MTALPSGLVDITPGEESLRAQAKAFAAGRNPGPSSDSIAGDARSSAKSSMAPMERSYLDDYVSLGSNVLPKWYTDFGGTFLKSAESFATGVGQGVVDAVSAVSGGLVDLSNPGGRIDTTHAERLLASEDPAVREQGQRLMNQAKIVDQSAREGFRGDIERRRESSFGAVDPESVASTAGGIAGGIAPSVLAMIPGLQVPVLAGYFANSYEQNYDAYANAKMAETGTYDPAIASAVGTVMGGVEAAFEYLPIRGVKNAARAAEEALFSAAKRAAPGWRLEAAKAIAKIMGVGAVQEGVEEGGTELVGELVRLSYDRKLQERYHTDPVGTAAEAAGRILKAAGTGAIGGVLLGGAGALTMAGAAGESGLSEDLSEPVRTPDSPDNGDLHQSGGTVPREEGIGDLPMPGQPQATETTAAASDVTQESNDGMGTQAVPASEPLAVVNPQSSDAPSLMKVAFGMANLEVGKEGRQSQRVGRPEAIRALRASGLLPTTTDPRDFAHEVISDPEKYAEFLDELRKSPELSRGQSEALFGEQEKMKKEEQRHQWVDAVLDLAASNAVDVGPNPPVAVPLPPGNEGIKAKQPEPPDERIAIRNDLIARFSESMVDQLMKLDDLVKRSEAALGRKLTEAENPILQLRLDKSHRAIEQQDFQRETLIPMLRRMVEKGITDEDVGKLAVAMHAEEANQQIAIRNPDDPTRGAGMSNEYAAQVMDEMSAHPESATAYEAAALIQTILQSRTELDNAHGIVSDQSMASMTDVYRHYVAMIDDPSVHMEGDDVAGMENVPRNAYSVGMQQRLNRLGREYGSLDDPNSVRGKLLFKGVIAHTVELYERGILRRHQNDALNTLRRFATSTAVVQKGVTVRFEPPFVKSLDRSENVVKQEMEALSAYKKRADVLYAKLDEDVTIGEGDKAKTYPKGSPFFLEVADERLADTLKNAPRPDPSTRALYSAFRLASAVVRFGATSGVSANYAVSNVIRDLGMAMAAIDSDPARFAKAKRDLVANMPKALKSLMAASVGKSGDSEMDTYLREFRDDGGIQEMFGKNDFDSAKSMVKHVLEPTAFTKLADAKDAMLAFATESTKPFENMTRLSYYVSLRKNGVDRRTAALRSRSLTVDFQVHGKNTGFMRAGWAFMNAGIQGTNKLQQMMRTPGGQAWAGVYFLSAVAETMAAYMYFGDTDEDKDGKPDWAAVTSWERDTKIRVPGVPVQLPVMWGMNVPKAMGHWIAEKMLGVSDDGRNAQAFANSVGDAFNPIGGADFFSGHGFFRTVLPDLLDPALDLYTNKDFLGRRIRNEPFSHDQEAAWVDSQHPMDGTPDVYSRIADAFNTISGGDEATSGLIDAAPETYRYLFMALAGGGARTVERLGKVITSGITGDPVAMSDVPIAGVVARSVPDSRAVNESYYDAVTDTQEFVGRMKAYENAGNDEAAWRMREEDPIRTDASIVITSAEKTLRAMREQLKELRKANAPHEDIKRITDAIMEEKAAALYTIRNGRR